MLSTNAIWFFPWLAGLLVTLTHVPLGLQVLQRGIIFLDLAIAQAAGLGAIIALLTGCQDLLLIQAIAASSAILTAIILHVLEKYQVQHLEAWIGCCFVICASLGLLLLMNHAHTTEKLQSILSGQLLWTTAHQLYLMLAFYLLAFTCYWFSSKAFYLTFALCITASVQVVGIYLVFATLIMPALAAYFFKRVVMSVLAGYIISLLAYSGGLWLSYVWDIPTSPLIVCMMASLLIMLYGMRWALLTYYPRLEKDHTK